MGWAISALYFCEKFFIVATVIMVVYAGIYFNKSNQGAAPRATKQKSSQSILENNVHAQPIIEDNFSDLVFHRDLFDSAAVPSNLSMVNAALPANALPVNLKVVGIIIGQPSELVIEDVTTHQTYFIAQGTTVGGIEVTDIQNKKATIKYQGQDIILPLGQT